ncbi:MAG: DUF262 domain-containing protein [Alcaligenaceae bacterium]|nr:DUF262 domain-containing protein [Alcaligenaceae bacterium]
MKLPEPQTRTFPSLVAEIDKGQVKIPQFQRDFVWSMEKSAAVIDSIIKGYPIGTFIFWRTTERLRSIRNIGNQNLPELDGSESVDYVLDGQQRLTSLYACLKGAKIERSDSNRIDDYSKVFIDLSASSDEQIVKTEAAELLAEKKAISVLDLLAGDFQLLASYPPEFHENLKTYKSRIESYQYSIIQIKDAPIAIATEIFTRINVGGKPLTLFEIMVAKTYDHDRDFDLSNEFDSLVDELQPVDYETISDATVLQAVALVLKKECKRQVILQIDKDKFIDAWPRVVDAIKSSVEYFRNFFRIPVSALLPYNALIAPFAYFFYHHTDKPTGDKQKYLQDFFWRCSLGARYSSSVESKLAQDVRKIDEILAGNLPKYDWGIDLSEDFLTNNGWFSAGRSYIKAILCLYAYHQPKSFNDGSVVNISNNWLKRANSKNYHHFFPRAYLRKENYDDWYANHVLNITIVDDFLNKREIGAKAPSKYMAKFQNQNPELGKTMRSHLISDLDKFGIWENDYEAFMGRRATAVKKELEKRIIHQEADERGQSNLLNDYEEEPAAVE